MNLATSTCLFPSRRQGGRTPMLESIDLCHAAGFRVIDLNFCGAGLRKSGHELCQENWEEWVDEVGNHAAKLGVTFSQSHTPFDSNLYRIDVAPCPTNTGSGIGNRFAAASLPAHAWGSNGSPTTRRPPPSTPR